MSSELTFKRALIIGLGSIGRRHLKNLTERYPRIELTILRHREPNREGFEGINHITTSLSEALDQKPEFAIVCNPSPYHVSSSLKLAEQGVHIFIEKPISSSTKKVENLLSTVQERDVKLMVGYNLRFLKSLIFFREKILDSVVGSIFSIKADVGQNIKYWRKDKKYSEGVSAKKSLGGGALLELSHEFDYLSWIFGKVDWVSGFIKQQSNLDIDVEDLSHCLLGFKDQDYVANVTLDLFRHDPVRECEVIGEEGTIKWDALKNSVQIFFESEGKWKTIFNETPDMNSSYKSELDHFFDCIINDKEPLITGESALSTLKIIEGVRHSSKTRKIISLQD